jgi:hypothetical protein
MASQYVRVSKRNSVNMGRLYSIPPWGANTSVFRTDIGSIIKPRNPVNLGKLYEADRLNKRMDGWAYLDDGSIFISPIGWTRHDVIEGRLKIAAQFVRDPTPRAQGIRRQDPDRQRFLLIR